MPNPLPNRCVSSYSLGNSKIKDNAIDFVILSIILLGHIFILQCCNISILWEFMEITQMFKSANLLCLYPLWGKKGGSEEKGHALFLL